MDTEKLREIAKELSDTYRNVGNYCLAIFLGKENDRTFEYYCVFGIHLNSIILVNPYYASYKARISKYEVLIVDNNQIIGTKNVSSEIMSFKDQKEDQNITTLTKPVINKKEEYDCDKEGHFYPPYVMSTSKCIFCGFWNKHV